jgi:hypothetical protein
MNVVFSDFNMDKIDFSKIYTMKYLHDYLDNDWNVMKKKNTYVLKKDATKLLVKSDVTHYLERKRHDNSINTINDIQVPLKYILCFLYNTLNNGWTVKKKKSNYIFFKKHGGKKEYMSDDYIATFIKEHFNYDLI